MNDMAAPAFTTTSTCCGSHSERKAYHKKLFSIFRTPNNVATVVRKNFSGRIVFSVFAADSVKSPAHAGLVLERNCTLLFVSAVHLGGIRMLLFVSFSADFVRNELIALLVLPREVA